MDTEPYISTVDDLDKFMEEMDTEVQVTEPVTPKKVIRFVIYIHISTYKIFKVTLEILSNLFLCSL